MDRMIELLINPHGLKGSLDDCLDNWVGMTLDDHSIVSIEEMAHGHFHVALGTGEILLVERESMIQAYQVLQERGRV